MRISGLTVIRNAQIMGYPVIPSIKSLLPLVDEMIVGVGQSDDQTKDLIAGLNDPKIKMFDSVWDTQKTKGGLILSEKTNEALKRCTGDWCFYLQADEVLHEQDFGLVHKSMETHLKNPQVEGLLFKYIHFYGSYEVIATARNWYRNEVRIVRNGIGAESVGDAQGFRVHGQKPRVMNSGGRVFHYGWVKPPQKMGEKNKHMFRWWHGNKYDDSFNHFAYKSSYGLRYFKGTHPAVMAELVKSQNWSFSPQKGIAHWEWRDYKNLMSDALERVTGYRLGEHKNFVLIK
ncbi:MAG: glycosyltransferase family 2 protein [Oligoflexia bacterium]|nr:glycosyltransferase family 2 protein [Oligoflexia bacterium]